MITHVTVAALMLLGLAPQSRPREQAVLDLTGYWVSVITEDWRWRMLTPPKGDASGVPLTIEGRKATDQWDPAKDEAAGLQCRAYGAAGVMREPTRLHVTWADDRTLKIEIDNGTQTRLLRFGQPGAAGVPTLPGPPTWQGQSIAAWEGDAATPVQRGAAPGGPRDLKVVTTHMRAGYLRKNGVPYSPQATLTEYFDLVPAQPNGDRWLVVTSIVDDPLYLTEGFVTSTHFRKEPGGSAWHPTPCSAR
jgi:hypothetical protein